MKKILTVIIPAYNAEAYLENCLDIIVVSDGSIDHTGTIADRYQMQFPGTVRVIHKENGGHGSGINCGITTTRQTGNVVNLRVFTSKKLRDNKRLSLLLQIIASQIGLLIFKQSVYPSGHGLI